MIELASNVDSRNGEFEFGKKVTMKCVSRNGWPGAKLSWYLDGVKLTEDVGAEFSETSNRRTTVQQIYRRAIAVEDNRKKVTCRAEHTAYPGGFMETSLPIKLKKGNPVLWRYFATMTKRSCTLFFFLFQCTPMKSLKYKRKS